MVLTYSYCACEAESAERAEAWLQAATLWRLAAKMLRRSAPHGIDTFDLHARYLAAADRCECQQTLEQIAQAKLGIPTLRQRNSDGLDFHEVSVWGLKRALAAAYEAGRNDATE